MTQLEKINFHIISHTHWDREWYLPFEVFRLELVKLIDNLLEILEQDSSFIFHLDGQTIILQDYLEIKPHKKEQIKKFVKSGNLLIGPWYVLSDQFLTSGESTIRNFLYGIRDAKNFGGVMYIGYCPDQFGQISQLPQILNGFNIKSAIIGRGIQDSIAEHNWFGLNGDSVLAIALTHWYNNAQRLPDKEKLHNYLDKIYTMQSPTSRSGNIFLMNGCDHLFAQKDLKENLKGTSGNQKWQIGETSLPEAIKSILESPNKTNFPIYYGELRDDNNRYILAGTLSSRVYLKLINYSLETKLEKIIEPLSVFCAISKKIKYQYEEIKYAWELLMENHAHDSICGCSTDEVHKEMETRFLKVNQVTEKIKENLISDLHHCDEPAMINNKQYLQAINLTNYNRIDVIETELEFPMGPAAEHPSASPTINKPEIKNIVLKHEGKIIQSKILENTQTFKMIRSKNEVPLLRAIQKIKILFAADVKPFSACSYEIEENERDGETARRRDGEEHCFENENYKLRVNNNGTLSVVLKENNFKFENIHFLSIEEDVGDEYNFVANEKVKTTYLKDYNWNIKVIEENDFRKVFLLATDNISALDINIEIICTYNSNRIDFKTKINNRCKNKRIRLHFPTNLHTNYLNADTALGVLQRARPPVTWTNYAYSQPLYNWIDHSNETNGLAFFGSGLADYELYEDGNGFALTLIRAVGKLSTVKSHSLIETPEAQCNREINFSYAIFPHKGIWEEADIQKEQLIYQTPIITNHSDLLLNTKNLITLSNKLLVSILKRAEDNDNLYILRVFNPYNKKFNNCRLKFNFPYKKITLLNLNEDGMIKEFSNEVEFEAKPHQILTFGIEI